MLSYTLENAFMFTVFQLLLSGLVLCSGTAVLYLQKNARKELGLMVSAFCFYSLYFLMKAALSYRSLSLPDAMVLPVKWETGLMLLEKAALVLLGSSFLAAALFEKLGIRFWTAVAAAFLLLGGIPYLGHIYGPAGVPSAFLSAMVNGVWLAAVAGRNLKHRGRMNLIAGTAFLFLSATHFLRASSRVAERTNWQWNAENATVLIALGLFALVVESRSANLPIRFFLRLNLIFIAVASMLILTVAELERSEYLRAAEQNTQELFEYLRGQVVYSAARGLAAREVLASPEIVSKIIAEFGRAPDLRRVRVSYLDWVMEMGIGDDWLVSQGIYPARQEQSGARVLEDRGRIAMLTPVPIEHEGRIVGKIELDESLGTINAQVARHMRIIFVTFTAAVFIAAGLFWFTVQYAHRTIQQQFQELEKTGSQLIHAERLASVGLLASGVAHEINNPAGIILTTSDYLLRESERANFPETYHEGLQAIRRQAWRISEIVRGLLTFSRPTKLDRQPLDLNAIVERSLLLLAPRFREQQVQVDQKLGLNLPSVSGDPDRLEQVFVNLLNNAADAMPHGGKVSVETRVSRIEDRWSLVVSIGDSGSGIAPEHLKSIFDPFFSTKPRGQGTGLGLSVSHGIIRDHGGRIEAESSLGEGTTLRVYLPCGSEKIEEV